VATITAHHRARVGRARGQGAHSSWSPARVMTVLGLGASVWARALAAGSDEKAGWVLQRQGQWRGAGVRRACGSRRPPARSGRRRRLPRAA